DNSVLNKYLQALRGASGKLSPALDGVKVSVTHPASCELCRENIRCGYRVLNRQIDADASYGRHRMRGIANADKAGTPPPAQAIYFHGEQAHIVPLLQFADTIAQERRQASYIFTKLFDSALANLVRRALGNDKPALPILLTIAREELSSRLDMTQGLAGIAGQAADAHPQDIHGRAQIHDLK